MLPDRTFDSTEPPAGRDASPWILDHRGPKNPVNAETAYASLREWEPASAPNGLADVWTVFLTNRECPWRCLMCDLWKNTLDHSVSPGALPRQLEKAIRSLAVQNPTPPQGFPLSERVLKLYNSGSFFDRQAIPTEDHPALASLARNFDRVIVECHPKLVGERVLHFRDDLIRAAGKAPPPRLELALGLETAHGPSLERLNKGMTLADFFHASDFLQKNAIGLRVFLLVHPPLMPANEQTTWMHRSIDCALDAGASVVSLIPTRMGNGALDALHTNGDFHEPSLGELEEAFEYGLKQRRSRVLVDLWDLHRFSRCGCCFDARRRRLEQINWTQVWTAGESCPECGTK